MPLPQKRRLMCTCMAPKHSFGVHVVCVGSFATDMILGNQQLVKVLFHRHDGREIVEDVEKRMSAGVRVFLQETLNPVISRQGRERRGSDYCVIQSPEI